MEEILAKCDKNIKVQWVQEENINGGSFYYAERRISRVMRKLGVKSDIKYVGRRAIATTAVGSVELHKN